MNVLYSSYNRHSRANRNFVTYPVKIMTHAALFTSTPTDLTSPALQGISPGSGTRVNFDKYALNGATEVNGPTQDASGSVVQLVGQTPGAISYVAFSYTNKPGVKAVNVDGVEPTYDNVKTNAWKIWSYEHMYTNKSRKNTIENKFIEYVQNDKKTLEQLGYIRVSEMKVDRDAKGNVEKIK